MENMDYDSFGFNDNYSYQDYNATGLQEEPRSLGPNVWVPLVLYALAFLLGSLGNGLVIWVVGFQMKRTVNAVWFLNLSVADLLCCLALPFLAVPLVCEHRWYLGDVACKLLPSLTILNMFASVLLLTIISMDRCALVLKPVWCQNHRSPRLAWACCGAGWALALVLTVPSLLTRQAKPSSGSQNWTTCGVEYGSHAAAEVSVAATRFLFGFLLPLAVISACYGLLVCRVRSGRFGRSKKTLKVVLVVVVGFFVCWTPYHVVGLILASEPRHSPLFQKAQEVDPLVVAVAFLNSCINPVIYVIAGQDFKAKVKRSLKVMLRNVLSEEAALASSLAEERTQATGTATTTTTTEDPSTTF